MFKIYFIILFSIYLKEDDVVNLLLLIFSTGIYSIFLFKYRPYILNEYDIFDVLSNGLIIYYLVLSFYQTNLSSAFNIIIFIFLVLFTLLCISVFLWKYFRQEIFDYTIKRKDYSTPILKYYIIFWKVMRKIFQVSRIQLGTTF